MTCPDCLPPPDTELHLYATRPDLLTLTAVGPVLFEGATST